MVANSSTMRAFEFRANRTIVEVTRAIPEPGDGEVRVRVAFTGICGTDLHEYYEGPVVTLMAGTNDRTGHVAPIIPGHEASGVVDAVGAGVSDFAVGDRVALEPIYGIGEGQSHYNVAAAFYGYHAQGFLADYAVVKRTSLHHLPDSVSLADGALVEPLSVAVHAVARAQVAPDETTVVFGGGPIGVGLSLVLAARGIRTIVVVEPSATRAAALRALGFTVLDPGRDDFEEALTAETPDGVQVVFDAAGASSVMSTATSVVRPGGRIILVATYPRPIPLDAMAMLAAELSIIAVNAYDRGDFQSTIELLTTGRISSQGWVEQVPFADAIEVGYPRLRSAVAAKVLVEVGGEHVDSQLS
ncbi:MAG: theronine dehydrogenase-like Zn-dependent dehydrogenase [Subtercola sp.]|nr:theronine dehydrogenase-like Zn-dependent dehydrogenase [Subtercola sp.]